MSGIGIREILNGARWRDGSLHALELELVHRGAPGDRRVVSGARIALVRPGGVELVAETTSEDGDTIFVPYHRFVAVRGADGAVLWSKADGVVAHARIEATPPLAPSHESEGEPVPPSIDVVLRPASAREPLVIDGSAGEGGGQILRSSLALSIVTGTPFAIERIRAGRKKPGLLRQHLTCVKAAAAISGAEVEGAALGSTRLVFRPEAVTAGEHELDVGSAGSVALVVQTIALPLLTASSPARVVVRGGTHALWAPIVPFLVEAWVPLLRTMGAELTLALEAHGFHPAGGGAVVLETRPSALAPLHLPRPSGTLSLAGHAVVSDLSENVARRELVALAEALPDHAMTRATSTVRSPGPGNAAWLVARDADTSVTNVFSGIGEPNVRAEDVGTAIAERFACWRVSGASVEEHLADQLMLPIALAGNGSFDCDVLSLHARTNDAVIAAFTGRRFEITSRAGGARHHLALA
ncbi:MAG: RNA 3'-terminal phosphate cyclase [Sandaracinus sp.]